MKKIITIIIGVIICFQNSFSVFAAEQNESNTDILNHNNIVNMLKTDGYQVENNNLVITSKKNLSSTEFVIDRITLVPKDNIDAEEILLSTQGDKGEESFDSSVSVKAFTRIYYTRNTSVSPNKVRLERVTGGYSILDNNTVVTASSVLMTCYGVGQQIRQSTSRNPGTSSSWSYYTPSNWVGVSPDVGGGIGANYSLTLKRSYNTHTWSLSLSNLVEEY